VGNVATYNSGGLENDGGTVAIAGCLISSNSAANGGASPTTLRARSRSPTPRSRAIPHETTEAASSTTPRPDPEQLHAVRQFRQVRRRLFQHHNGTATIYNSTFSGNTATNNGGGIVKQLQRPDPE